jgi:hypothetical protein
MRSGGRKNEEKRGERGMKSKVEDGIYGAEEERRERCECTLLKL